MWQKGEKIDMKQMRCLKALRSIVVLIFFVTGKSLIAQVSAGFSYSAEQGCAPFSVNFINTSDGAVSYQWNFGNGNFSNAANPQNVYVNPGIYTVSLVVTDAAGNKDTLVRTNLIKALAVPTAGFTVNRLQGCANLTNFTFSNTSSGATGYFWDFGDGNSSVEENPSKMYPSPGLKSVKLMVSNGVGCQAVFSLPQQLNIMDLPNPDFSADLTSSCDPSQLFKFSAAAQGAAEYLWQFGDGTVSTQASPNKIFSSPGTYAVSLKVTNQAGCSDSLSKQAYINIYDRESLRIIASDSSGCAPFKPKLSSNINDAASYQWDFGNGQTSAAASFSPTYSTPGQYNVTLKVTMASGCSFTRTEQVFIWVAANPIAGFGLSNTVGCAPLKPRITNTSTGAVSYLWSFGDNTSSNQENPEKTYIQSGQFTMKLTVTSAEGCSASFQLTNSISVNAPVTKFNASDTMGCPPHSVSFNNLSLGAASSLWIFSDGTTSNETNPSKIFNEAGNYDVTLVVTGSNGCKDTLKKSGYIRVNFDQASYTPPPPVSGCAPLNVSFENNDPDAISYRWDFGDGYTSTAANPSHVYESPGTYTVSLVVDNGTGCKQLYPVYQVIKVEGGEPGFTVDISPCPPHIVSFKDTTHGAVSWYWEFGDGSTSTEQTPGHLYAENKIHHVSLTTTTASGCSNTYIGFNAVNFASLAATFVTNYVPGPFPRTVYFSNTTPGATNWHWDFGDGNTSTEQNPVHVYQTEGDYLVNLVVNSDSCKRTGEGSAFSSVEPIQVTEGDSSSGGSFPPENFVPKEPLPGCAPITIIFFKQDTSHHVLLWSFGDGGTSTMQRPKHVYKTSGYYSVFYIAETPNGLDTIHFEQAIRIGGAPPDFSLKKDDYCTHSHVEVRLLNNDSRKIKWTFGGTVTVQGREASHDFPVTNSASIIQVMIEDTLGCKSSALKSLFTNPPYPEITYPAAVCKEKVKFRQTITDPAGYTFQWDFGDGGTSTDFEPEHQYSNSGIYQVKLTVKDPTGCINTLLLPQKIAFSNPMPGYELLSPAMGCSPLKVDFKYTGNDAPFWIWNTVNNSFSKSPSYTYSQPGVYGFTLKAVSETVAGCSTAVTYHNVITVFGTKADFKFTQSAQCFPVTVEFTDLSANAVKWNWNFGNGIRSTEKNPRITFYSMPSDSFALEIESIEGCRSLVKKPGLNLFRGKLSADYTSQCSPLPVKFKAEPQENVTWQWFFGDGNQANGDEVTHTYALNGNYSVYAIGRTDQNCIDTVRSSNPVIVASPDAVFTSPTPAGCAPSVVEFKDLSADAASWKWDFGDGSTSSIQHPSKLYERPGKYDIKLIITAQNGCSDTTLYKEYVTVLGPATTFSTEMAEECEKTTVHFKDLSNGAVEWSWNFGEGRTSKEQHPVFTYDRDGHYTISLFSKDTFGCSAFYTHQLPVVIHHYPEARFSLERLKGCAPLQITAGNQSSGATKYYWNFSNLAQSNSANGIFTFGQPGNYFTELIAETDFGCRDTFKINNIQVLTVPKAGFTTSQVEGCTPLHVTFNNNSYQTEQPVYAWDFGNGNTSTEENPVQVYFNPGYYDVQLLVRNNNGCADTILLPSIVQVFDTLAAPVSPIIRVSVEDESSVVVEWEQSFAPDFGKYTLYRKNNLNGVFEPVTVIQDAATASYTDHGLNTQLNVYCYKLETSDRCGYYVETDSLIEHCTINVEVETRANNTVDIQWTPYVGKTVSQYRIFRQEENSNTIAELAVVKGDILTYNDSSIFCPVKYKYSIKAEGLNGIWHVFSKSDYDISAPIKNLFADQRVDASRSTVVDNKYVLTEWKKPEIMGHKVTFYTIYRSVDNINFDEIAEVPAYQFSYVDEAVNVQNVKYYYRIMAGNDCGLRGVNGGYSDNIVLRVAPTEDYRLQLNWTPYSGWGDHGVGFYVIERQKEDGSWEIIKQVPGQVSSAVDEN